MLTSDVKRLVATLASNGGMASYSEVDLPPSAYKAEGLGLVSVVSDGGWGDSFIVSLTNEGREAAGLPRLSIMARLAAYFTRIAAI